MSRPKVYREVICCVCGTVFPYVRERPRKTCSPECHSRLSSEVMARTNKVHCSARMKTNNPMHRGDNKERAMATLRAMGHRPPVRRGNGHGATEAEAAISAALGWPTNVVVKTGMPRDSGYPTNYKIDVGNAELKVGIEVDGASHQALARQAQDRKKEDFLRGLGWIILRVSNRQALEETGSTISRLREAILTSRTTYSFTTATTQSPSPIEKS